MADRVRDCRHAGWLHPVEQKVLPFYWVEAFTSPVLNKTKPAEASENALGAFSEPCYDVESLK
jgi:hypothetical protein